MKKTEINVLIIEDDASMRNALSEAVKRKGFRAVPVAKADEVESIVRIKPVHAIISDVMLPGRNGIDLLDQIKDNLLDGVSIIFISGIYRDKAFAQEALKKVGAVEYFIKPFNIEEVINIIDKKMAHFLDAPKVDLHSLLATPFASERERKKALERVEEMNGYDLPFVFCILMDSESSGHLNIIDFQQNIYGVTFYKGGILKVDSEITQSIAKNLLVQQGFITEDELNGAKKSSSQDVVKSLVDQGLVSPHASEIVQMQSITKGIGNLITNDSLNFNFVADRKITSDGEVVSMNSFLPYLHDMIDKQLTLEWLKKFYSTWSAHPIQLGPQFSEVHKLMGFPLLKKSEGLIDQFKKECTIEEILAQSLWPEDVFYKTLHFLMIRRVIVFQEIQRVKNLDEHITRLKAIFEALKDKNPVEIFMYFGLSNNPKATEVIRVFKEFAKSNHPDTLPQSAGADIKKINHDLYSIVSQASDILSNEDKKKEYFNSVKQKDAEKQLQSDEMVSAAAKFLNLGKYADALTVLEQATKIYSSERSRVHLYWAQLKVGTNLGEAKIKEIETDTRAMSASMRKAAIWMHVSGLIKKNRGDIKSAADDFNRALQAQEDFMDARRELSTIKAKAAAKKSSDILTGDLSVVLSNILKKKKSS